MGRTRPEVEEHESFGWATVNTVQSAPAVSLFDSEIKHGRYVVLSIARAGRSRELNRDWIHGTSEAAVVEVAMSMAQWGALVSSFGQSGVPVTIQREHGKRMEEPDYSPRLAHSIAEVEATVGDLMDDIKAKTAAIIAAHARKAGRTEMAQLHRDLEITLDNSVPNATYAAKSMTEHVENVVTKARYDIEAAARSAAAAGLDAGDVTQLLGEG